jgi:hypothetical protein
MPKSSGPALRILQPILHAKADPYNRLDHQLGNAIPPSNPVGILSKVDHQDLDLPSIVGVDGARSVEKGQPMSPSQAASWTNLRLKPFGKLQADPRRDEGPLQRIQSKGLLHSRMEIQPRGMGRSIGGKRKSSMVFQSAYPNADLIKSLPSSLHHGLLPFLMATAGVPIRVLLAFRPKGSAVGLGL